MIQAASLRDTRLVGVNERGNRVGEDHPRARLSNADVDAMFEMREPSDGSPRSSYAAIARAFGVSKGHVSDILSDRCRRRAAYPVAFRRVKATARFQTVESVGKALNGEW
jgi:hypothetical protein